MHYSCKSILRPAASLVLALIISGCGGPSESKSVSVTGVTLDKTSLSLTEGQSDMLHATVEPSTAYNKGVSWTSSEPSVASVSGGTVQALKAGSAQITVKTDDGAKTASCSVTVTAASVPVSGVSLDKASLSLTEGDEAVLKASVSPDNATDKSVSWESSDPSVASVSAGKVSALKAGSAVITVRTKDGGKTASCQVSVKAKVVSVTGVTLSDTDIIIKKGESKTLTAKVLPENATNKSVKWTSSDTKVVTVENGTVKAVAAGSATVTVTTEDGGKSAVCKVKVTPSDGDTSGEIPEVPFSSTK